MAVSLAAAYGLNQYIPELRDALARVIANEHDHVWHWHIENRLTMHRLLADGVGRLVGNPPWLVRNETKEGNRKTTIDKLRKDEGIYVKVGGYLSQGDLASVFTARVTRLYLGHKEGNNKYGWVLPGSALINQVWQNWRKGLWGDGCIVNHEVAWDLSELNPPVFSHAPNGTSVVLGSRVTESSKLKYKKIENVMQWTGSFESANILGIQPIESIESSYRKRVEIGCMFRPFHYFEVEERKSISKRNAEITTVVGKKNQWKGIRYQGIVEKSALLRLVTSNDLKDTPICKPNLWLIAPMDKGELMLHSRKRDEKYPLTSDFWRKCNEDFRKLKGKGATETLEANYGFPSSLKKQTDRRNRGKTKLIHNSSGNTLRAARISSNIIVDSKCYWIDCKNVQEAQYLAGVINSPNMQDSWRASKTSKLHFHTGPWSSIPVPEFDRKNKAHLEIARVYADLERKGVEADLSRLNTPVKRLLPLYAK